MTPDNLRDLYVHQLRDLHSAETQIAEALPVMEKTASHPQLKQAFKTHLAETKRQKERLERVFEMLGEKAGGVTCHATKGLVKEANDFISDTQNIFKHDAPDAVVDAGLIAQAQRVEHYEISSYGTVCQYAETLGLQDQHRLLSETLSEEKETDGKLNRLAKELVNPAAVNARA